MKAAMQVRQINAAAPQRALGAAIVASALVMLSALAAPALAGSREQAMRMHDRLNGSPPTQAVLDSMQAQIDGGNAKGAALLAIDDPNGNFYSVVLKNFAMPWTNRDQTAFAPLNDYVATVVGMVRDEVPFNTLLSADLIYVGKSGLGLPAYSNTDNNHYVQMEAQALNLRDVLVAAPQSATTGLPAAATAGVITTRAAARAFFILGTNRAMFRFTMINHMCTDLQLVMDITRPTDRIRQDVSRSPGGDSRVFLNNCVGCHSGMDPMVQAFAFYDYVDNTTTDNGSLQYTPGTVVGKYFHNNTTFAPGYITPDDHWDNRWRTGQNSLMGWDSTQPGSGNGAKSLGAEIGASGQFAQCQVTKVFQAVCLRAPSDAADRSQVATMVADFKQGYSLKNAFAEAAVYCMGN
ncbi:MAG TPA: hypothetical protein VMT92_05465 [Steroidobacteraceae bacterium]|nr:hypothetical protein [Steroidobacteraceae bacterium]